METMTPLKPVAAYVSAAALGQATATARTPTTAATSPAGSTTGAATILPPPVATPAAYAARAAAEIFAGTSEINAAEVNGTPKKQQTHFSELQFPTYNTCPDGGEKACTSPFSEEYMVCPLPPSRHSPIAKSASDDLSGALGLEEAASPPWKKHWNTPHAAPPASPAAAILEGIRGAAAAAEGAAGGEGVAAELTTATVVGDADPMNVVGPAGTDEEVRRSGVAAVFNSTSHGGRQDRRDIVAAAHTVPPGITMFTITAGDCESTNTERRDTCWRTEIRADSGEITSPNKAILAIINERAQTGGSNSSKTASGSGNVDPISSRLPSERKKNSSPASCSGTRGNRSICSSTTRSRTHSSNAASKVEKGTSFVDTRPAISMQQPLAASVARKVKEETSFVDTRPAISVQQPLAASKTDTGIEPFPEESPATADFVAHSLVSDIIRTSNRSPGIQRVIAARAAEVSPFSPSLFMPCANKRSAAEFTPSFPSSTDTAADDDFTWSIRRTNLFPESSSATASSCDARKNQVTPEAREIVPAAAEAAQTFEIKSPAATPRFSTCSDDIIAVAPARVNHIREDSCYPEVAACAYGTPTFSMGASWTSPRRRSLLRCCAAPSEPVFHSFS